MGPRKRLVIVINGKYVEKTKDNFPHYSNTAKEKFSYDNEVDAIADAVKMKLEYFQVLPVYFI